MKIREIETRKPFLFCVMVLEEDVFFFFCWLNEVFLFRVEENNKNSLFLTRKLVQIFFLLMEVVTDFSAGRKIKMKFFLKGIS